MLNKGKKGVSGVVTVVILVALVLVAIGVVWGVVSNLLEEQSGSIDVESACMNLNLDISSVDCDATNGCDTVVVRRAGGDQMDGYFINYYNQAGETDSNQVEVTGGLPQMSSDSQTFDSFSTIADGSAVTKIEVTPYVEDSEGNSHVCQNSDTYNL